VRSRLKSALHRESVHGPPLEPQASHHEKAMRKPGRKPGHPQHAMRCSALGTCNKTNPLKLPVAYSPRSQYIKKPTLSSYLFPILRQVNHEQGLSPTRSTQLSDGKLRISTRSTQLSDGKLRISTRSTRLSDDFYRESQDTHKMP